MIGLMIPILRGDFLVDLMYKIIWLSGKNIYFKAKFLNNVLTVLAT